MTSLKVWAPVYNARNATNTTPDTAAVASTVLEVRPAAAPRHTAISPSRAAAPVTWPDG